MNAKAEQMIDAIGFHYHLMIFPAPHIPLPAIRLP